MLNNCISRNKKILVCAPSNAAIDEIVTRIISKGGLLGQNEHESIEKVVRIGSMDYEPSKIVQQVIFDQRFIRGGAFFESNEQREKINDQIRRWQKDGDTVLQILNLLDNEKKNESSIRKKVKNILANKD